MSDLTFNPHVELTLRRTEGRLTGVTAAAPVKGRPLRVVTFTAEKDPAIVDLLARVAAGDGDVEVDLADADWDRLAEAGVLVPENLAVPPPLFRCSPQEAARDWPSGHAPSPAPARPLLVSPDLRFLDDGRPPAAGPFARGCAWATVPHPDFAVPSLLSLNEPDRALLRRLRPNEPEPPSLPPHLREALFAMDVLLHPEDAAARREARSRSREAARAQLARALYTPVHDLFHPSQIAALRRYYRDLVEGGRARFDDRQVPLRFWLHNEPIARFFHRQLAAAVSDLAGEPMKPSYVFFASYRPGAVLEPHRDRAQCALSVSLLLDYQPDPSGVSPWPLWLGLDAEAPNGRTVAVEQSVGDALLYRGTDLAHWRRPLPEGHTSTSLFLHYVPVAFDGPLD